MSREQYIRQATLVVSKGTEGLDLSEMRFSFRVSQSDMQSPNNCAIRIHNLSPQTSALVQKEFSQVTLQAGYEGSGSGVIFTGDIKQFRRGKESAVDTYLDILAADGDLGYNFGVVNKTLAAGASPRDVANAAADAMKLGRPMNFDAFTGGTLPRGKVLFGMARDTFSDLAATQKSTWSVQNGQVQILPLTGYLRGEAVVLDALSGMVGIPEQTEEGIRIRCLLNPRLTVGGSVKIDNASINKLLQQDPRAAPIPFNQWTGIQLLATIADDGLYRVFVVEHSGDNRGQEWYSDLICLAINAGMVDAYG